MEQKNRAVDFDDLRVKCGQDLMEFTKAMYWHKSFGRPYIPNTHHRAICDALHDVVFGKTRRLIINVAPRYGKTELVSKMFIAWGFTHNPASRFVHLSYSDDLVMDNSREINEMVRSDYYRSMFPWVDVTDTGAKLWRTSQGGGMYAASTGGQVTGFGAGLTEDDILDEMTVTSRGFAGAIVIDDPLKPEDALSDVTREKVNARFDNTIRSRVNSRNTPIIIIMQRLHEQDLCGYLLENEPDEWKVLTLPCLTKDADGNYKALWELKHNVNDLLHLQAVNPYVFETQYQQNPTPIEGLMYRGFKTYDTLPVGSYTIKNYTDTADTGADWLCSITYAEFTDGMCYVLDILFTNKPMEYTEVETAKMLTRHNVAHCIVESNNGGRGFRRNVEKNCREMGNRVTRFEDFTQTQNKQSRIFSHSNEVLNMVVFPSNWERLYPDYNKAMKSYRKEGNNLHDDAPDCTTGVVEHIYSYGGKRFSIMRTEL